MSHISFAQYIWLDGNNPSRCVHSKARVVQIPDEPSTGDFPQWSLTGASIENAHDNDSTCLLIPVSISPDPLRGKRYYLVFCEVRDPTCFGNQQARFRGILNRFGSGAAALLGFGHQDAVESGRA